MARKPRSLADKVVVITGGGRGIGAATAMQLAQEGAVVAIGDLDETLAKETASRVGGKAVGMALDVTDHAGFTTFLDQVERELGPIDVLVNNAGIMPLARIEDESHATTHAQVAVNLLAVIHGTKEAVRRMKARGAGGHIVNISSAAGRVPVAGGATYTGTKHAVSGFSNALHIEFTADRTPIDITAVHPAIVRTELSKGMKDNKGVHPVTPEDVAAAVVDALKFPKPNVYVPKSMSLAMKTGALVPQRVGEWLNRVLGGERAALDAIASPARQEYENRVAQSAPGAEKQRSADKEPTA
ncbi:MAG TPA: SDR family oxidoreductase [Nocardioidaceae bacterium]|nr:SDR family oxidoreductase [Nocardioidaceae bacterium]